MCKYVMYIFCISLIIPTVAAREMDEPLILPVWPGKTVADFGEIGPERVRAPQEAPTRDAKWITNVTRPTISVFRPPAEQNAGVAIIVCPGGGYWNLAWDREGEDVARWLNTLGVTGVVLKYRVPRRPGQPEPLPAPGPLLDAQRAVSLVRSQAHAWGIDPERIGIMGFSAGGHLAVMTATSFEQRAYEPIDALDETSCRPNFAVVAYPGYLKVRPETDILAETNVLADYIRIPKGTGPMFLVHAHDDEERGAPPDQSVAMYLALRRAGVPAELHIYSAGRHGFGVKQTGLPVSSWTDRCADWMKQQGILRKTPHEQSRNDLTPLPEGHQGIAARYQNDSGIGTDAAVLLHDDFETDATFDRWDMVYHRQNIRFALEPEHVHGGARALELTVPKGRDEVSNELVKRLGAGHDTIFLRYYSKFDDEFDQLGSSHNGGILLAIAPGVPFATPGIRADGTNKFTASLENWRGERAAKSPGMLNVYCYHPAQRTEYGDHFFPSGLVLPNSSQPGDFGPAFTPRPEIVPELGRWYCYELMLKANSPSMSDGRIACWLDGKLVADFPNLRLRGSDALKINHAGIGLHIRSSPTRENRKWYDDVVIATSYIGPKRDKN